MRRFGSVVLWVVATAVMAGVLAGCGKGAVAVVNGRKITEEEFHGRLETMQGPMVLGDMIAREILMAEANSQGIQVSASQVDEAVAGIERNFPSHDAFMEFLTGRGQTMEQFRDEVAASIMTDELRMKGVEVSDQDVEDFFNANRAQFDRPATWRVNEIQVADEQTAKQVRKQLDDPRASFDTTAREHSIASSSAAGGGGKPPTPLSAYAEEWQPVLASLKVGDVSRPIKTESGWWIIKVVGTTPAMKASLDDPNTRKVVLDALKRQRARSDQDLVQEAVRSGRYRVAIRWPRYKHLEGFFTPPPEADVLGPPPSGETEPGSEAPVGSPAAPSAPAEPGATNQAQPTTE